MYKDQFEDPIAHFTKVVEKMNADADAKLNAENAEYTITLKKNETNSLDKMDGKKYIIGHAPLMYIYNSLNIDKYIKNATQKFRSKFPLWSIFKNEIMAKILKPESKMSAYKRRRLFYDNIRKDKDRFNYELHDAYRGLSKLTLIDENLQEYLFDKAKEYLEEIDTSVCYFYSTNYYFEIDAEDDLRKKGVSKVKRPNPIVQMGLLMSKDGIPVKYKIFPGNTNDSLTIRPKLEIARKHKIGRIVVIADKELNTSKNIKFQVDRGDGYIFSQKIRGSNKEFQTYILEEDGYEPFGRKGFKLKSRVFRRTITIVETDKTKMVTEIDELQVVFYSPDQAKRSKIKRGEAIKKACFLIENPSKYDSSEHFGAKKYIKGIEFKSGSGEILERCKKHLYLDEEKIKEEEKFDGYYSIISSETNLPPKEIVELYKGLWKTEETFKITKSVLDVRPMYLKRDIHIRAHFLICYVGLLISRILEIELENKFTTKRIRDSLYSLKIGYAGKNVYICNHFDEVIKEVTEKMRLQLNIRNWTPEKLRELFSKSKLRSTPMIN
ncbi:MAG: IS1634 family transposase [Christensenellaceae bacterium]|nr:IS1634 family transposase [Christensenellaceae bacterium]